MRLDTGTILDGISTLIGGIDLGGTKIEARAYDDAMTEVSRRRIPTDTTSYQALLASIADQVSWLKDQGVTSTIGLGTPGLIHPETGRMLSANLPATGHALGADLATLTGHAIPVIKDCRAFALAEATHGAGIGYRNVIGLIIGTGVAGGHVIDRAIPPDHNGQSGEFGHLPLPAHIVSELDLPVLACGCGLVGCFETLLSGPGLTRLAHHMTGQDQTAPDIWTTMPEVKSAWLRIATSLVGIISRTADPDVIVLGGGLGTAHGLAGDLAEALDGTLLAGTTPPRIVPAQFGDASGAFGAAIYAQQDMLKGAT